MILLFDFLLLVPPRGFQLFTFSKGETIMVHKQLEKLQRDSAELQIFAEKLKEEGNHELVKKVIAKREYLDNRIQKVFGLETI